MSVFLTAVTALSLRIYLPTNQRVCRAALRWLGTASAKRCFGRVSVAAMLSLTATTMKECHFSLAHHITLLALIGL